MEAVHQLQTVQDGESEYRLAPHNVEAEQALLGAVLVNNEAFYRVSDFLFSEHFYEPVHREIYDVLGQIIRSGKTATPVTAKPYLEDDLMEGVTMSQYLARLAAQATTVINAYDYGQTIYDLAIQRSLILIGEEMTDTAYKPDVDTPPHLMIENAEKQLFDLAEKGRYDGGFRGFNKAVSEAIELAGEAYRRDGKLSGTATGFTDLDRQMGGLQRSDLIILAGRPGMAKTSLATNIAVNVAKKYRAETLADGSSKTIDGGVVGFFSLEMSSEQLATRILSAEAEISSADIRRGDIHESQFGHLVDASSG